MSCGEACTANHCPGVGVVQLYGIVGDRPMYPSSKTLSEFDTGTARKVAHQYIRRRHSRVTLLSCRDGLEGRNVIPGVPITMIAAHG